MNAHTDIIRELDEYCRVANVEPSTVCRNATGNPRLRDRLLRRLTRTAADIDALRQYMAANPPSVNTEGSLACAPEDGGNRLQAQAPSEQGQEIPTQGDAA